MLLHASLTNKIIKCFYTVYNKLGYGFLEKVYENAMAIELEKAGFHIIGQQPINVYYEGEKAGFYCSDITVENKVILELKARPLILAHEYQLLNYLKATDIEVGLLLSFGKEPTFKRKIFQNHKKSSPKKSA